MGRGDDWMRSIEKQSVTSQVLAFLRKHRGQKFTTRQIYEHVYTWLTITAFRNVLEDLAGEGKIIKDRVSPSDALKWKLYPKAIVWYVKNLEVKEK